MQKCQKLKKSITFIQLACVLDSEDGSRHCSLLIVHAQVCDQVYQYDTIDFDFAFD